MISGRKAAFEARCLQRGYTLEEVRECIVAENGDMITVNEQHPAYPRAPKLAPPPGGAGTELKAILASLSIKSSPNCSCNARAQEMDARGPDWCERNLDTIVGWLRDEAEKRRLPFLDLAARTAVRLAIRRARKRAAK